jgi:hypothetical protein
LNEKTRLPSGNCPTKYYPEAMSVELSRDKIGGKKFLVTYRLSMNHLELMRQSIKKHKQVFPSLKQFEIEICD